MDIPHASSPGVAWGSQQGAQSSTQSPAVIVNVIQPGATFVPSPAHPGWPPLGNAEGARLPNTTALSPPVEKRSNRSHESGSKPSGSGSSSSNTNSAANNDNGNDSWQNTTSGAQDWATNTQEVPQAPGAWGAQDNIPQGASQWNENGNNDNSWATPGHPHQANQTANDEAGWDNGNGNDNNNNTNNNNSGTDHPSQQNSWEKGAKDGSGGWNYSWANNNNGPPPQIAGDMLPQQSTWENGNGAGNENNGNGNTQWNQNQPDQGQKWGPSDNDNRNAGAQSWKNFGNVQPASVKQYNSGPGMAPDFVPCATADTAAFHQYPVNGHPQMMPMTLQPKPYWSKWNAGPDTEPEPEPEPEVEAVEGPIYQVSRDVAQRHWMSHQVLLGKPATYMHRKSKPKYIDTHESPYAVFVFHYRSKGTCAKICAAGHAQTNSITRSS